jgi:glucose dehydrogenase
VLTNVAGLAIAWTYDTGENGRGFRGWSVTPLVIDGVMYFGTYAGKLVALTAETGAEIWKFDLKTTASSGRCSPRGISYWPGDAQTSPRVVATTTDGLLTSRAFGEVKIPFDNPRGLSVQRASLGRQFRQAAARSTAAQCARRVQAPVGIRETGMCGLGHLSNRPPAYRSDVSDSLARTRGTGLRGSTEKRHHHDNGNG